MLWKCAVIAFWALIVIVCVGYFVFYSRIKDETELMLDGYNQKISLKKLDKNLLDNTLADLKSREAIFENNLLRQPSVKDPSF